jgi:hypothetical protein
MTQIKYMYKKKFFSFKNNLVLITGIFILLLEYYVINNGRDHYISMFFTILCFPFLLHTLIFKKYLFNENSKQLSIFLLSSNYIILALYATTIILIYDFTLIYNYSSASKIALKTPYGIYLLVATLLYAFYLSLLFKMHVLIRKSVNFILVLIGILFCCFLAYHLLINDLHRYNESSLNLGIVVNPIVQVFYGATVMIDTKSQYGLYPHFFEPILYLTGISMTSISAIMMMLFLVTIGSWFFFLLKTTQNSFLSLIGLIPATFVSLSFSTTWPGELYYQYFPIRTVFPALVLLIFSFYYNNRGHLNRIIISTILSLGILWNVESGIGSIVSFILLDMYLEFDTSKKFKSNVYAIIKNTLIIIITLSLVFLIFFQYLNIRSGTFPSIKDFFYYTNLYAHGSIYGIKGELHPHMFAMILIYFFGTSYGVGSLLSGYKNKLNSGIFLISVFGMSNSLYYMFKGYHISHEGLALYPIIILITLFVAKLLVDLRTRNLRISLSSSQRLKHAWLIENHLRLGYLILTFSFLSFLTCLFLTGYKHDTNFTTTARYHEIMYPTATNNKALGIIKLNNFDSGQHQFDYIRISDLYNGNPKNIFPKWINTYKALEKYKNKNGGIRKDMIIFSMYDHFLYLNLKAKMPVKYANSAHIWYDDYDRIISSLLKKNDIQYIIIDNDELVVPLFDHFEIVLNIVERNFDLIENIETGNYVWYDTINPSRTNKKEWGKHLLKVYKRKIKID